MMFATSVLATSAVWSAPAATRTILIYGDSLSAAYGLSTKDGWPTLLQDRLRREKFDYTVANASISGETSAGGASRIVKALETFHPEIVVVALGSNDGLRGLPIAQMKANLATIIDAAHIRKARVLVVGNRMPPNYGPKYTEAFFATFAELARDKKTGLIPFILEPISSQRDAFQGDNMHPTAAVQPAILDHIWSGLKPLLKR